ncbi:hypothetical protein K1T71_010428 [Dendrolimus kikuchii]|uniref:Uncharacterized protein n=1 Tax=Dendrolimus kikuchii TaxID=765133 RepID=A0ACC1CSS2_9NEOP|nr:hypothetical protein K1T71_010428 [Dendrolimus kikuchii]
MADRERDGNIKFPRKLMKNLILRYKEYPCLWDMNSTDYTIKSKRHDAITKLTELVQEHDSSATRVHVLRKLESMRSCVRREYKKVQESRHNATCEDDIYTPHLWYYDIFPFIYKYEQEMDFKSKGGKSTPNQNAESDEEIEEEENSYSAAESFSGDYSAANQIIEVPICSPANKRYSSYDEEPAKKRPMTEVGDEYDAIGINVAAKLRYLPPNMRVLAEKLINDVLFQAQTNGLTQHTTLSTPDPFKQE